MKIMDIVKGEASDNYTTFYLTNGRKYVVSKTLKFFEDMLIDFDFSRVHKSFLVNVQHITKYKKGKGGEVIMVDGSSVPVSPLYKSGLLKNFK
jgi:two-component system LytT family response regulator